MDSTNNSPETGTQKPLRLKLGITLLIIQWVMWYVVPQFTTGGTATMISVFGGLGIGILIFVWWGFLSRIRNPDRWISIILIIILLVLVPQLTDPSIKTGMGGLMYYLYAIPVICMAGIIWLTTSRKLSIRAQRYSMILVVLLASGIWILFKSDGLTGNASAQLKWRWAKTNEEKLLAQSEIFSGSAITDTELNIQYAGFRGSNRDGIIHDIRIETDWKNSPPIEMWRKPIGPGCSSFAIRGSLFYTQEQRGEDEIVSCYHMETGELVWMHKDKARFWDAHAGAGPRSTPTLKDSLVYTLGTTGILNVLNANDGSMIWSRNAATDLESKLPGWGYTSSPLVVDSTVIVAISGTLAAYDISTGEPRWYGPFGKESYSSPQLFTFDGIDQVILMSDTATRSFVPATGELLWEYPWGAGSIVQPALTDNGDLLISEGYKKGIHRITVSRADDKWTLDKQWFSSKIRPDFNDNVIHKGHLYGYDGFAIVCIDLEDGSRKWKHGRYGGQLLLLEEQDLLIILSEKGDVVLAKVTPDQFTELAKIPAIEGKTWNHPAMADDVLLVRNTQEMVAYKLKLD